MTSNAAAYRDGRQRIEELTSRLSEEELDRIVPACPEWSIKELVAHLTGIASDSITGNLDNMGQADWTENQVAPRRDKPLDEILEEWDRLGKQVESGLDDIHPAAASSLIADLITHELDIRGALGDKDARAGEGVVISTSFYARNFGKRLKDAGLPTVIVECGEHQWTAGREEPEGYVRAPMFEMLRGLTGRRTLDEVKGFDWTIDAAPYLDVFAMYPVIETSLNE